MVIVKLKIQCRIEEVPSIGGMLISSITKDLADFTALSPLYDAAFIISSKQKLAAVEALINPKKLTSELKVITLRMLNTMEALKEKINHLEIYIGKASGLTIGKKDFGIGKVRYENNQGDVEGLVAALGDLLDNVTDNMAQLTAVGYTPAQHPALQTIETDLAKDNTAQNDKMNERNNNVTANYNLINEFWLTLTDICKTGKAIYKTKKPNKVDDYTITSLKRRMRQEQLKNKMKGTVTADNKLFPNARIELKPILGGRKRATKSKSKGGYELKSLIATDYIATASAKNKQTQNSSVTIVTGETLTHDIVLLPV